MSFDESVLILICMSTNEREWVVNEVNPVCTWVRMTHNEASVQNMYATHGVWHIMHSVTILHAAKWVFYASYRQCLWYQMMWYDLECNINEHIMHPVRNETNSGKKRDHTPWQIAGAPDLRSSVSFTFTVYACCRNIKRFCKKVMRRRFAPRSFAFGPWWRSVCRGGFGTKHTRVRRFARARWWSQHR